MTPKTLRVARLVDFETGKHVLTFHVSDKVYNKSSLLEELCEVPVGV